jgi:hypothetical protein
MNHTAANTANSVRGLTAMGIFLCFGAVMAALAGISLVWRGTALDQMWALNPRAYEELARLGRPAGISFLFLSVLLAAAGIGWLQRRLWGWWLAVIVMATQVLGNLVNIFRGRIAEGGIGVAIAGALLLYLMRAKVRAVFERHASSG